MQLESARAIVGLIASGISLLLLSAFAAGEKRLLDNKKPKNTSVSVNLRRELQFEHPLMFPQDGAWLLRKVVAMPPNGSRAIVLIPGEKKVVLGRRPSSGLSERSFLLSWINLSSGQIHSSRELFINVKERFGFSMDDRGEFFCVIAGQRVTILNDGLSTIEWKQSELTDPLGEKRIATTCTFVPGSPAVLIGYTSHKGPPWQWSSSLMQWKWKESAAVVVHSDQFFPDNLPLGENRVLVYSAVPDWLHRFRLEELDLSTRVSSAGKEFEGFHNAKLVDSENLIFRVDGMGPGPGGTADSGTLQIIPERFRDRHKTSRIEVTIPKMNGLTDTKGPLQLDDRVVVWDRAAFRRSTEFRSRGVALHWPLAISHNEKWFVVRAAKFSHIADNGTLGWTFNQFMIFSLNNSKRQLYSSEKFGPQEAITGFALSRDDRTLVVTTSSRLLIYEVTEMQSK